MYRYDAAARERRAGEPAKRAGAETAAGDRTEFARDRARVLHSYAFRRLADKTQVVVPGEDDFPRTRLTHSLEVAQIAREIGHALGCDPDIVDAAGLAHDIGHPPFGHNGETALDAVAAPCGGFEGNAQTLRVLTRLEAKVVDGSGKAAGLNLTRAVLDAACKYPWPRRPEGGKFGVYPADADAFAWLRADAPGERRCLEAQVMDWADDVAYSVHDVEDGVHAGLIELSAIDDAARAELCHVAAKYYSARTEAELAPVLDELLDLPTLRDLAGYDGSYTAQAAAKRATSELTGRFAGAAIIATRAAHGHEPLGHSAAEPLGHSAAEPLGHSAAEPLGHSAAEPRGHSAAEPLGRYAADLVVPAPVAAECALLKAMAAHYVMSRPAAVTRHAWQRAVLTELVEAVLDGAPGTLDPSLVPSWRQAADDAERLRVVVDQVAQLTDSSALAWHERLVGPAGGAGGSA